MTDYIKSVLLILFAGALVILFLTMGLAILAAAAVVMPFVYWWYRWKINKKLDELNRQSGHGRTTVIDVEYEIVDENEDKKQD